MANAASQKAPSRVGLAAVESNLSEQNLLLTHEMAREAGVVSRWNDERGFGFIAPGGGGEELFCHRTAIEDGDCLIENAPVAFERGTDKQTQRERALRVTGGTYISRDRDMAPPAASAPNAPARHGERTDYGTVKHWNAERGFGFIAPDGGGEDVFAHVTAVDGGASARVGEGARVRFASRYDERNGKERATRVWATDDAPADDDDGSDDDDAMAVDEMDAWAAPPAAPLPPPATAPPLAPPPPPAPFSLATTVVIDGANIAHAHSADGASFSARGVALAVGWFAVRGFAHVVAFLPQHHLLERPAGAAADRGGGGAWMQTEEWAMLDDLRRRGFVAATPSTEDDDTYIITFAARIRGDAVIVSNDHYRQHPRGAAVSDAERAALGEWLRDHRVGFTFVRDDFIPNPAHTLINHVALRQQPVAVGSLPPG